MTSPHCPPFMLRGSDGQPCARRYGLGSVVGLKDWVCWPSAATANAATAALTMSTNPARPACDILALPAENEDSRWIGIADFQREPLSVSHAPSCGKRPNPDVDRH